MDKQEKSKFTQWLETLQQESWQLELVISGFAIFLLIGLYEPMQNLWRQTIDLASASRNVSVLLLPVTILQGSWLVLLINLIIHILLRGLWISTVGLRYVSEEIDFDALRLHDRFDRFLRKHIVSFDRYIERLEKICSIIFAFSFLLVFILMSLGLWQGLFGAVNLGLAQLPVNSKVKDVLDTVISLAIAITSLIYFIDFVTFGWVKRRKRMARFYYPLYRFYGWITLSFLYRPLYYNLADNRFGRGVGFLLVPYILVIMVVSSISIETKTYFPLRAGNLGLSTRVYDDLRDDKAYIVRAAIPSKYVSNGFLEVFVKYNPNADDKSLAEVCPNIQPARRTGIQLDGIIQVNGRPVGGQRTTNNDSLLLCLSQIYRVYVNDSLHTDLNYRFYTHPRHQESGVNAVLDVGYLDRGEHLLRVESLASRSDSTFWQEAAHIPFWKE
jgi:hypothetical protein